MNIRHLDAKIAANGLFLPLHHGSMARKAGLEGFVEIIRFLAELYC